MGQGMGQGHGAAQQNRAQDGRPAARQPQLPPPGAPRAELPGGPAQQPHRPESRPQADGPRGHDDFGQTAQMPRVEDHGAGSTAQFPRPDFDAPAPQQQHPQQQHPQQGGRPQAPQAPQYGAGTDGGQYPQQGYGVLPQDPTSTGQFPVQDPTSTGQFPVQGQATGQYAAQDPSTTGQFAQPQNGRQTQYGGYGAQQQQQQQPARPGQGDLPPGDGRSDGGTPLFDSLETNWFRGQQQGQQPQQHRQQPQAGRPGPQQQAPGQARRPQQQPPQAQQGRPQQGQQPMQQRPAAGASPQRPSAAPWRSSPNDELSRQAERARKPSAGGVTTSGLPKRVPKANLVPGTAQQNQHTGGPQVSRAPDAVRGRLTNLRRGIAQGRQASSGQTGSYPSPTHQQER
jgi:hypothetical protein